MSGAGLLAPEGGDQVIYNKSSVNMEEVPDNSVQLVVTSPPYPMIKKWDELYYKQGGGTFFFAHDLLKRVWAECKRVLIDGGMLCINIGDATRTIDGCFICFPNYAKIMEHCLNVGFTPLVPILWKKIPNKPNKFMGSGMLPVNAYVTQECEYIAILRNGNTRKFSPTEKKRREESRFTMNQRNSWFSQIWEVPGKRGAKSTSQWPEKIPRRLIRMFSIKGDTVLDPFCGFGLEKVCSQLSRKFIGYDIREPVNKPKIKNIVRRSR